VIACGRELALDLINVVVWVKTNGGQGSLWRSQHELLPVFKKGGEPHINNVELGRHGRWAGPGTTVRARRGRCGAGWTGTVEHPGVNRVTLTARCRPPARDLLLPNAGAFLDIVDGAGETT
jgi:hypothetical protein